MELLSEVREELIEAVLARQPIGLVGDVKQGPSCDYKKAVESVLCKKDPMFKKQDIEFRFKTFCRIHNLNTAVIKSKNRDDALVRWRVRFLHTVKREYTLVEMASVFGFHRSTVHHLLKQERYM